MKELRPVPEHVATLLITTHRTHKVAAQADALHISQTVVLRYRRALLADGLIKHAERAGNRPITDDEMFLAEELIAQGYSMEYVAAQLKRPPKTLWMSMKRRGLKIREIRQREIGVRSLAQVAELFGVTDLVVLHWIRAKFIKVQRSSLKKNTSVAKRIYRGRQVGDRRRYLIPDAELIKVLALRVAWPTYNPDTITDPFWREAALEERRKAGGQWVTMAAWANTSGWEIVTVRGWIAQKKWQVETIKSRATWYIWVPTNGTLPPCPGDLPRKSPPPKRVYPIDRTCLICDRAFQVHNKREYHRRVRCSNCYKLRTPRKGLRTDA